MGRSGVSKGEKASFAAYVIGKKDGIKSGRKSDNERKFTSTTTFAFCTTPIHMHTQTHRVRTHAKEKQQKKKKVKNRWRFAIKALHANT